MARSVYATIEDIRQAGLSDDQAYPDERISSLLELASEIVEHVTRQVFGPTFRNLRANGRGRRLVEDENRNKIIEVFSIQILRFGLLRVTGFLSQDPVFLTTEDYTVQDRFIRLRPNDVSSSRYNRAFRDTREHRLPNDDQNVEITAVFGWLALEDKFETTLAEDLAFGATTIKLTDTDDIEPNDLLMVNRKFWVIVKEITIEADPDAATPVFGEVLIDSSPKKAKLDPSDPTLTIPVVRYGKVPRLVREATVRTAIINSIPAGSDEETSRLQDGRIRREETDNYEYELFALSGGDKAHTGTGDPIADGYLSGFRAPTVAARWV